MALNITIEVTGVKEMLRALDTLERQRIEPVVAEVLAKYAEELQGKAKEYAPVDTGFLRYSIQRLPVSAEEWWIIALARYALYQEEGWTDRHGVFHEGRHYMLKAAHEILPLLTRALSDAVMGQVAGELRKEYTS